MISLKHAFQTAVADGGDTSLVRPSNWNAEHVLTMASGKVVGRLTAGDGAAEELTIADAAAYRANTADRILDTDGVWASGALVALSIVDGTPNTVALDLSTGLNFSLTMTKAVTLSAPTNAKVGQSGAIVITQNVAGSQLMTFNAAYKFVGGAPALSTAGSAVDYLFYWVESSSRIICHLAKAPS